MEKSIFFEGVMKHFNAVDIKNESVFNYVDVISADDGKVLGYKVIENIGYYSERYKKWVVVEKGDYSDGATYAPDLDSFGWIFHDELCNDGMFEDHSECNNLQASSVLSDIMAEEGRWFRRVTWFCATWLFGGGKARKNGMF